MELVPRQTVFAWRVVESQLEVHQKIRILDLSITWFQHNFGFKTTLLMKRVTILVLTEKINVETKLRKDERFLLTGKLLFSVSFKYKIGELTPTTIYKLDLCYNIHVSG